MPSVNNNISAIQAMETQMDVTANNVANVNTDGFKKSTAVLQEGAQGGVVVSISRPDTPPGRAAGTTPASQTKQPSNVDLAQEIPGMIPTQRGYEANLKAIEAQNEMLGSVINLVS
jgi:flagellar hook protein FlgE